MVWIAKDSVARHIDAGFNVATINQLKIVFGPEKRAKTLTERDFDFRRAADVFAGRHFTLEDAREDYSETRYITVGNLDGRMVIVVWTPYGDTRRIISMRNANEREQARYAHRVD